jgi:hypothetical protein
VTVWSLASQVFTFSGILFTDFENVRLLCPDFGKRKLLWELWDALRSQKNSGKLQENI